MFRLWVRSLGAGHVVAYAAGVITFLLFLAGALLVTDEPATALVAVLLFGVSALILGASAYAVLRDRTEPEDGLPVPELVRDAMERRRARQAFIDTQRMRVRRRGRAVR